MNWSGLLVSVRDADEARQALAGGAAIIDVKEPARGSLGAASPETVAAVASAVGLRVPWTMACGELVEMERDMAGQRGRDLVSRVGGRLPSGAATPAAVKVGLAGTVDTPWELRLAQLYSALPAGPDRVAVAYADWQRAAAPHPLQVIRAAGRIGCRLLLVDTFDKSSAGLFGCCAPEAPAKWVDAARAVGLRVAIAGKIALDEISRAWGLNADVVAVRSAVCCNGREGTVRADLVRRAVGGGGGRDVMATEARHLWAGERM